MDRARWLTRLVLLEPANDETTGLAVAGFHTADLVGLLRREVMRTRAASVHVAVLVAFRPEQELLADLLELERERERSILVHDLAVCQRDREVGARCTRRQHMAEPCIRHLADAQHAHVDAERRVTPARGAFSRACRHVARVDVLLNHFLRDVDARDGLVAHHRADVTVRARAHSVGFAGARNTQIRGRGVVIVAGAAFADAVRTDFHARAPLAAVVRVYDAFSSDKVPVRKLRWILFRAERRVRLAVLVRDDIPDLRCAERLLPRLRLAVRVCFRIHDLRRRSNMFALVAERPAFVASIHGRRIPVIARLENRADFPVWLSLRVAVARIDARLVGSHHALAILELGRFLICHRLRVTLEVGGRRTRGLRQDVADLSARDDLLVGDGQARGRCHRGFCLRHHFRRITGEIPARTPAVLVPPLGGQGGGLPQHLACFHVGRGVLFFAELRLVHLAGEVGAVERRGVERRLAQRCRRAAVIHVRRERNRRGLRRLMLRRACSRKKGQGQQDELLGREHGASCRFYCQCSLFLV